MNSVIKFPRQPFDTADHHSGPPAPSDTYSGFREAVESQMESSLRLAQEYDFYAMCAHGLWGAEVERCKSEYGMMLRGLIEEFLPRNGWDLRLLSSIAVAAWKVRRLSNTQANVFNANADSSRVGKHGLPIAVSAASSLEGELEQAQEALRTAIRVLKESRSASQTDRKKPTRSKDDGFIPLEEI